MRDFRSLEQKIRQVWLDEAEARNTAARKKVENVGRPQDSVKDPETSKLAKQGEIKTKIIDEVTLDIGPNTGPNEEAEDNQKEKDPRKITGGKTEVILDPKTDDRPEEQSMEDEKQKKTVKQENKKIGTKSGVKEETMTKLTFGLPDSLIDTVRQVVEAKKMDKVCPKCGKSPCQCESMKEELKGGQKKLDKNHNGRLDAEDFKILRGEKKGMKEEVEQIDEISSKKLDSYREKAFDASKKAMYTGDKKTEKKRDFGRHLAFDKLTGRAKVTAKEEVSFSEAEQIDELSKGTLGSYVKKASMSVAKHAEAGGQTGELAKSKSMKGYEKQLSDISNKHVDTAKKRLKGISTAASKMAKEEVSFSEAELSHFETVMGEAKQYNVPTDKDMGPLNVAAQIRKGKEVGGHVEVTHPATGKTHKIPVKTANKFNTDYATAEKPAHKEKIEQDFIKQHMS